MQQMYLKMFELMFLHLKHLHEQETTLHRRLASSSSSSASSSAASATSSSQSAKSSSKKSSASSSSSSSWYLPTSLVAALSSTATRKEVQSVLRGVTGLAERLNAALVHVNALLSAEGFLRVVIDLLGHADSQVGV